MTSHIPPERQGMVDDLVRRGLYKSEEAVVAAVWASFEQELPRIEALLKQLLPAMEELERGECIEIDADQLDSFFDGIIAENEQRLKSERKSA